MCIFCDEVGYYDEVFKKFCYVGSLRGCERGYNFVWVRFWKGLME